MTKLSAVVLVSVVAVLTAQRGAPAEGTITTDDGVRIFYRSVGSGQQTVIIPVAVWTSPYFDTLARRRRVIYYDPRGRGRSDTGDLSRVSIDRAVRDLDALREKLGVDQFALVGWSGYGLETAMYALAHPERVSRLVQLNPVPPRLEPFMTERTNKLRNRVDGDAWSAYQQARTSNGDPREACRQYNRAMLPAFVAKPEARARVDLAALCELSNEWPANQDRFFAAFMPSIAQLDLRSRLDALRMPRLIVYGDQDLIPLGGVAEWLDEQERGRIMIVHGADHNSFMDAPDAVMAAIDTFLQGRWPQGAEPKSAFHPPDD